MANNIPEGGRYSYDNPPVAGTIVLSPNGRQYRVIRVNRNRDCVCQRVDGGTLTVTFQANDLRYVASVVTI